MAESKMPARIWATCNGMSTRLPGGKRQFIGGWSEYSDRPRAIEYVRADAAEELVKALEGTEEAIDSWRQALSAADMRHLSEDERAILVTQHDVIRSALSRFRSVEGGAE